MRKPTDYLLVPFGFEGQRDAIPDDASFLFFHTEDGKRIEHLPEEHHGSDVLKPQTDKNNEEKNKDDNGQFSVCR